MTLREIMSKTVVRIRPDEPVGVAARALSRYNIGALPVCGYDGRLRGVITDRDIVTRCLAADRDPAKTTVGQIMTGRVVSGRPEMNAAEAAELMGREQIRRLPILENGRLCGMVSLGDLAEQQETRKEAQAALEQISGNLSKR